MKKLPPWVTTVRKFIFEPFTLVVILAVVNLIYTPILWSRVDNLQSQVKALSPVSTTATSASTSISSPSTLPLPKVTSADHILGSINAKVILVEYADLECPFCKEFNPEMQQLTQQYNGNQVAWVYRPYPLSFHQNAEKEAEAQECVAAQGGNAAFWKYTDAIFQQTTSNGTGFALTALEPLAVQQGLNGTEFNACLNSGQESQAVTNSQSGGTAAGVTGTPTMFLVKSGQTPQIIQGAITYTQLQGLVQTALQ